MASGGTEKQNLKTNNPQRPVWWLGEQQQGEILASFSDSDSSGASRPTTRKAELVLSLTQLGLQEVFTGFRLSK